MKNTRVLTLITALALISCSRDDFEIKVKDTQGKVTVGFAAGDMHTKTMAGEDGLSTLWQDSDEIALWAARPDGTYYLSGQEFGAYGLDKGLAYFTAELPEEMPEGTYTYCAAYPIPLEADGKELTYLIPDIQDGLASSGSDIMLSEPVSHGALKAIDYDAYDHSELSMSMRHLTHRLRFYTLDGEALGGESIRKIEVTLSKAVTGRAKAELGNPSKGLSLSEAGGKLTIIPAKGLAASDMQTRRYAYASILPATFDSGDMMQVKVYTDSKTGIAHALPLAGRSFAAGHSTPVMLSIDKVSTLYKVRFDLLSNHLGEDVQSITLTAPEGCKWSDSGSNVYTYETGSDIREGHSFELEYEDEAAFMSLSGQNVTVTYDSEHVTISEQVSIQDLSGRLSTSVILNVPYLLYEDFSAVEAISSNDQYTGGSNAGSKNAVSFLNGWTGGRMGAQAGTSIRLACRRETSADYDARVDSAPLRGTLKKAANIAVEFDYGANNRYGGIPIITDGNVGQNCMIGYVTATTAYKSGDSNGTFEDSNTFYIKEYTGSYTDLPNNREQVLHDVPVSDVIRIAWKTKVEHQAGTTNTTAWLYLDNIKVRISKK